MTRDQAIARSQDNAIRDIPASCNCGDWQYQPRPARWVLGRPHLGCPWHLSRERAA